MRPARFPLDLSARAYPMMQSKTTQSNFRFGVFLTEPVRPSLLSKAAEEVLPYYPNFKAKIVNGVFWNELEESFAPVPVKEDDRPPLSPLRPADTGGYPFRIAYNGKELILEVFHAVTDGNIGAFFLSDLLTRYAELLSGAEEKTDLDRGLELSDAFVSYGKKRSFASIPIKSYNGRRVIALGKKGNFAPVPRLISEEIDLPRLKTKAKAAGATITEYVAACYIRAILADKEAPLKKPLSLFVPVNLRRFFPSNTLQNFVCFERINIERGAKDLSFEAVLSSVKEQFRDKITKEGMQRRVDDVKNCFRLPIVNYLPLFIKRPAFKLVKRVLNKVRQTAILSNIGEIRLSPIAETLVEDVRFYLNVSRNAPLNVALVSFRGSCRVDMTCALLQTEVPERFFALLNG